MFEWYLSHRMTGQSCCDLNTIWEDFISEAFKLRINLLFAALTKILREACIKLNLMQMNC